MVATPTPHNPPPPRARTPPITEGKTDDNIADAATADERRDGDGGGEGSSERSRKGKVRYIFQFFVVALL